MLIQSSRRIFYRNLTQAPIGGADKRYEFSNAIHTAQLGKLSFVKKAAAADYLQGYTKEHYSAVRPKTNSVRAPPCRQPFEDSFEAGERLFVIREDVEGTSLKQLLAQENSARSKFVPPQFSCAISDLSARKQPAGHS
jgi:hypothetical protein